MLALSSQQAEATELQLDFIASYDRLQAMPKCRGFTGVLMSTVTFGIMNPTQSCIY